MADSPTHALVRNVPRSYAGYYALRNRSVSGPLVAQQHIEYRQALEAAGLTVSVVDADENRPDCVFIEDTAVIWNQHALITRMDPAREGEQAAIEEVLRQTH